MKYEMIVIQNDDTIKNVIKRVGLFHNPITFLFIGKTLYW
jgi:hypothetical protein